MGGLDVRMDREDTCDTPLNSIEKLYVGDIENMKLENSEYSFDLLDATLSNPAEEVRAILFGTDIFVIGGAQFNSRFAARFNTVDVIDTKKDTTTLWGELIEPISGVTPILVGNRVYVFGGYNNGGVVSYWQYFDLSAKDFDDEGEQNEDRSQSCKTKKFTKIVFRNC